ncbi:MAG: type II toxin-antitoxin system death-on-curing family toxin [Cyanobacteria bacterium P01_G01_bin.39]
MPSIEWIECDEALKLHQVAISQYGGSGGLKNEDSLMSGLYKPRHHHFYKDINDLYILASLYVEGIACHNYPFNDGNKRTGFQVANFFLCKNGIVNAYDNDRVYERTLSFANHQITHLDYAYFLEHG